MPLQLHRLTYQSRYSKEPREDIDEPDDVKKKDADDAMTSEGDVTKYLFTP